MKVKPRHPRELGSIMHSHTNIGERSEPKTEVIRLATYRDEELHATRAGDARFRLNPVVMLTHGTGTTNKSIWLNLMGFKIAHVY